MIVVPIPENVDGLALSEELYAAGFRFTSADPPDPFYKSEHPRIVAVDDMLHIYVDGAVSSEPLEEEIQNIRNSEAKKYEISLNEAQ